MKSRTLNYIFVMLVVGAIALTLGSSILLRLSVCMLLMLVLAFASVVGALLTARVRISFAKNRAKRGEKVPYSVSVRFSSPLPVGVFMISVDADSETHGNAAYTGKRVFKRSAGTGECVFPHRGVYDLGSGTITVSDVFDLFTLSRRFRTSGATVTVVPLTHPLAPVQFQMGDTGPEITRRYPDDASSPSGVRDWRDGDLIKRIHWKLTMKMYDPSMRNIRPMVRTYDEASRPDTVILADLTRVDAVTERALCIEDAICEACLSFAGMLLGEDNPVRLQLGGSAAQEIEGDGIQDLPAFANALAVTRFDSDESFEETLIRATRRLDRTGAVVLVTSRLTLRVADCAIRLRRMSNTAVAVIWITDSNRADAEKLVSRLEMADVIARRDNPFRSDV